jgi:hypothetical protein
MTMNTMTKLGLLAVLAVAACGGKNKNATEEGGGASIDPNASSGDSTDRSGEQVDPRKMDEVRSLLDRKRNIVSRCLSMAIENGNAPKNARGKIVLEIKISAAGQTTSVEVINASIESPEVQGCVKRKVEEITFPQMSKPYETSYTYAMEAN